MPDHRDLIVITIDCMRADFMRDEITPTLCKLGRRGALYTQAYANGCGTPDSFPAIFASRLSYPFAHRKGADADEEYALRPTDLTLAEVVRQAGYDTTAFVAGNPYLGSRYGYQRGFDIYADHQPGELVDRLTGGRLRGALRKMAYNLPWTPYPSAQKVSRPAVEWLAARKMSGNGRRPFFLWVHYMDAHFPTLPPGNYSLRERQAAWSPIKKEGASHHDLLLKLYQEALTYIDCQVGQLLEQAPPEATVVVTADHGQLFGEHGSYWHNGVWEQLLRIPLIITGPAVTPGVVTDMVQLIDLSPHQLELLNLEAPGRWAGNKLSTPDEPIYAVSNSPGEATYTEALLGTETKLVRVPGDVWEYPRTAEPPDMVLMS